MIGGSDQMNPSWDGDITSCDIAWLLEMAREHQHKKPLTDDDHLDFNLIPEFFGDLREAYERFLLGNWLALLDVLRICNEENLRLPSWASIAIGQFMLGVVKGEALGGKGRGNNFLAKATDAVKKWKR